MFTLPPMTPEQRQAYDQAIDLFIDDLLCVVRHIVEHENDPNASVFDTDMEGGWETVAARRGSRPTRTRKPWSK